MTHQITFGSVCSGIEAASVAWHPLGWRAAWLAEIEKFPSAVLAHHYPDVPNLGDMTKIAAAVRAGLVSAPDILVGGTPCQAFSVAGLRGGISDPRGALTLAFVDLANAIDTARTVRSDAECVVTWENVPGVLSSKDNAFGCFLAALAGEDSELEPEPCPAAGKSSRYWKWDKKAGQHTPSWPVAGCVFGPQRTVAWRVTDAQYFGVAQRRRRVFVVASARKGFDPTAVLFELEGVRRDTAPSREAGQNAAADAGAGPAVSGGSVGVPSVVGTLTSACGPNGHGGSGLATDKGADAGHIIPVVAFGGNRTGGSIDISPALLAQPGSGWKGDFESETFLVEQAPAYVAPVAPVAPTLQARTNGGGGLGTDFDCDGGLVAGDPVAFDTTQITSKTNRCNPQPGDPCHPLAAGAHAPAIAFPANLSGTQCASSEELSPALGALNPTAVAFSCKDHGGDAGEISPTLRAMGHGASHANAGGQVAVAVALRGHEGRATAELGDDVQNCLRASGGGGDKAHVLAPVAYTTKLHNTGSNNAGKLFEERTTCLDANSPPPALLTAMQVRRLTPRECERLQSFPDDYTLIPWGRPVRMEKLEQDWIKYLMRGGVMTLEQVCRAAADGPRYKALGNSMCVYNMAWIGRRIAAELARGGAA